MIPKAELHVHLEGTAPPDLIRRLAERNGMPVPEGVFETPERFAYTDFLDFLRTYDLAASVIRTGDDYRDVTYEYLAGCARDGAIYVELTASPDHAALVGLSDEEHLDGIGRGHRRRPARLRHRGAHPDLLRAQLRRGAGGARGTSRRRATAPLRGRLLHGRRRGELPGGRLRRALRDRGCGRPRLHRARRRVGGRGERARRARAAGHAHRPRRALDRGPGAGRGAGPARRRARVLPDQQRGAGRLPKLRGPPAPAPARGRRARDARVRRSALLRGLDRRRVPRSAASASASTTRTCARSPGPPSRPRSARKRSRIA